MSPPRRSLSAWWLLCGAFALCALVLWLVLGWVDEDMALGAMPGWGALLYLAGGRVAVVGVFAAGAYQFLCMAVDDDWPGAGVTLMMLGIVGALGGLGALGLSSGWALSGSLACWLAALLGAGMLPERLASAVGKLVWFGGLLGGALAAGMASRWCSASLAVTLLAGSLWLHLAARRPAPAQESE